MKVIEMVTNAFWKGELGINGSVEDGEAVYKAKLYVKGSQVTDYSCSCAQGISYKGMCSHCRLLFDQFNSRPDSTPARAVYTSSQARAMIREYTNREVARIIREEDDEQVRMVPTLVISGKDLKLEFRVGRDRLYLIKDLAAFVRAVDQETSVSYGKNLTFTHSLPVFDQGSRPLVEFLMDWIHTYEEQNDQIHKNVYKSLSPLRSLGLYRGSMDRFFSLMADHIVDTERPCQEVSKITIIRRNPVLGIFVERAGKDGIAVSLENDPVPFFGENSLYILEKESLYCCDGNCTASLKIFMEQVGDMPSWEKSLQICQKDAPLFYERVLKQIASYSRITADGIDWEEYKTEELKAKFEFDSIRAGEVKLHPVLSYGDYSFQPVEDEHLPRTICRDVPGEFRISRLLTKYFKCKEEGTEDLVIRDDEEAIYQLLDQGMEEFMALGQVYLSDAFREMKIHPPQKISIGVKTAGNWLELDIDAGDLSGADLSRVLDAYTQKKKFFRMKNGEFLKLDDGGLMTVSSLAKSLSFGKGELQNGRIRLPKYRTLFLDEVLKEGRHIAFYRDNLFKSMVRGMKSVEDSDFQIPDSLKDVLRGYQKVGFRWLKTLDACGFGGILADDMGLGKTIQVIALILAEAESGETGGEVTKPTVIICPASLVYNWENEIAVFAPSLRVITVTGNAREREEKLVRLTAEKCHVVITSYDLLKRDVKLYDSLSFRYQIVDEAQFIKNAATQSARAVKSIDAVTRFALTGTPVENRLGELWSIFDFLMPGFLFGYQKFKKDYELPIARDLDEEALRRLHRMIGPFLLRRLKKDVLKELPDKLETVVYSRFEGEQRELYKANALVLKRQLEESLPADSRGGKLRILAELTKLRQICCDPGLCYENYKGGSAKLETCIDLIKNGVEGGHKILLFSQFSSMLERIAKRLEREGFSFYMLTGSVAKEERLRMVTAFHEDDTCVFLISLKAGGTGLNLTSADLVIHYDPWWNVAAQNQATDRAHRIGQERQVTVFKLITKDTIEENIQKLQASKQSLAEQIITEGTVSLSTLTKDDLLDLLQ